MADKEHRGESDAATDDEALPRRRGTPTQHGVCLGRNVLDLNAGHIGAILAPLAPDRKSERGHDTS